MEKQTKSFTRGIGEFGVPSDSDMEKIAPFLRKELKREELFVFSVALCDNDIDRDYERFTEESLASLAPLMLGKTGISDHDMKAQNQTARLFDTYLERSDAEKTALNTPLVRLIGRAYMLKTEGNREAIKQIEGGIRKEVSISCSVKQQSCSVCGEDIRVCSHIRGREYGGRLCHAELKSPTDGYEWSFVAVPAQKNAGVIKSKKEESGVEKRGEDFVKSVLTCKKIELEGDVLLSREQAEAVYAEIERATELAKCGRRYLEELKSEVKRLSVRAGVSLSDGIYDKLSAAELLEMKKSFGELSERSLPFLPQTAPEKQAEEQTLDGFKI